MSADPLVTSGQLCAALKLSRTRYYTLRDRGLPVAVDLGTGRGRGLRFRVTECRDWIAGGRTAPDRPQKASPIAPAALSGWVATMDELVRGVADAERPVVAATVVASWLALLAQLPSDLREQLLAPAVEPTSVKRWRALVAARAHRISAAILGSVRTLSASPVRCAHRSEDSRWQS